MNRAHFKPLSCIPLFCCFTPLYADVFKCVGPDGQVVFQDRACNVDANQPANDQNEVEAKCSIMQANPREYYRCTAEIQCDRTGAYGSTRSQCVRIKHERMEQEAVAEQKARIAKDIAEAKAANEAQRALKQEKHSAEWKSKRAVAAEAASRPVDCIALSLYAKAKGHGMFERAEIVQNARKEGLCIDYRP